MIALKRCYFLAVIKVILCSHTSMFCKWNPLMSFSSTAPACFLCLIIFLCIVPMYLCFYPSIQQVYLRSRIFFSSTFAFCMAKYRWGVLCWLCYQRSFAPPVGGDNPGSKECWWGVAARGEPKTGCVSRQQTCTWHSVRASWQTRHAVSGG